MGLFRPNIEKMRERGDVEGLRRVGSHAAWEALTSIVNPKAVPSLIKMLNRENYDSLSDASESSRAAAKALGRIGDKRAVVPLIQNLHDIEGIEALYALENIKFKPDPGSEKIVLAWYFIINRQWNQLEELGMAALKPLELFIYTDNRDKTVQLNAIRVLAKISAERAIYRLFGLLSKAMENKDHDYESALRESLSAIAHRGPGEGIVEKFIEEGKQFASSFTLGDLSREYRYICAEIFTWVIELLAEIGDPRSVMGILGIWRKGRERGVSVPGFYRGVEYEENHEIKKIALEALRKIGDSLVLDELTKGIPGADSELRGQIADALGEIKETRSIEPLLKLLEDQDPDVRKHAGDALKSKGTIDPQVLRSIAKEDSARKSINELEHFLRKYKIGQNEPGGFDTSDMEDYIKCIEEVASIASNDAIRALKKVQADPVYAEISIAVELALENLKILPGF
jgi:HEAT repeat protein